MPFNLHPDAKKRLVKAIADVIPQMEVKYGKFLERGLAHRLLKQAEKVLPSQGAVHDQLLSYIDELPLTSFVTDTLSDELQKAVFVDDASSKQLTEFEGYEDPPRVAQRLVDSLESLPHKYKLTVKLPYELAAIMRDGDWRTEFAPSVELVRGGPELSELCPLDTEEVNAPTGGAWGLLSGLNLKPEWTKDALYLQIEASGFVGIYGGSLPHSEALQKLREFCGLGLALKLFGIETSYSLATPPSSMFLHRLTTGEKWVLSTTLTLDADLSRALSSIRLSELKAWADAGQRSALINYIFDEMRTVFNGGKKANSILLASQWYFNGSHGSDELLEYVQLMVVLEIILGDKAASDQMGLNELLRNRCAYLIGNSHEDRASVLDLFRRIYEVRSQIVHRGKHRLSGDERILISQLRWLCLRVIQKEVDLLKEDKKSEPALPASCLPMWRSSAISALSTAGGLSWIIRYDVSLTFSSQLAAS